MAKSPRRGGPHVSSNPSFVLTANEAAFRLGVGHKSVRRLFERGELEGFKIGGTIRISTSSVEAYLIAHSNKSTPAATAETTETRDAAKDAETVAAKKQPIWVKRYYRKK